MADEKRFFAYPNDLPERIGYIIGDAVALALILFFVAAFTHLI